MRISDWGSDVCSSDLVDPAILKRMAAVRAALRQARERLYEAVAVAAASAPAPEAERGSEPWVDNRVTLSRLLAAQGAVRNAGTDFGALMAKLAKARVCGAAKVQKSVVEGKRVSVRVDLGGRRY